MLQLGFWAALVGDFALYFAALIHSTLSFVGTCVFSLLLVILSDSFVCVVAILALAANLFTLTGIHEKRQKRQQRPSLGLGAGQSGSLQSSSSDMSHDLSLSHDLSPSPHDAHVHGDVKLREPLISASGYGAVSASQRGALARGDGVYVALANEPRA